MAEKKKLVSKVTKTLLKNVIRHTDTHNRIVEESEMWKQRDKELNERGKSRTYFLEDRGANTGHRDSGTSFLKDRGADMNEEYRSRSRYQAHMDEEPQSTYWMRQLYKVEEADSNRWGHSGFKQLYPEQFEESTSDSEPSQQSHRKRKRHKEHRSVSDLEDTHGKKKRQKRKHSSSESESESQSKQDEKKSGKKHKHKHKKKKKKHKKEK